MYITDLEDEASEKIVEALNDEKQDVGRDIARRLRTNVYTHLQGRDDLWASALRQNITDIRTTSEMSEFKINHAAAPLHEFGGMVDYYRSVEVNNLAFGWEEEDLEAISNTLPDEYYTKEGPFLVPPKRYLTESINRTKREVER